MELRQCRYFISVAKLGSISQAALELHIAQPALTRQMQKLEEDLRVTLFNRTGRGVQLTDAGSQFLVDAEILINNVTVIKERAVRASRGECGNISLALPVIQNAAPPITTLLKNSRRHHRSSVLRFITSYLKCNFQRSLRESWMLVFYCLDLLMIRFLQESPFSKKNVISLSD